MTCLTQAMANLVKVFMEFERSRGKVCKGELKKMLLTENPKFKDEDIRKVMETIDKSEDDELSFEEFCQCVARLAGSHCDSVKQGKGRGRDKAAED